jgi:hypothetical protein
MFLWLPRHKEIEKLLIEILNILNAKVGEPLKQETVIEIGEKLKTIKESI